MANLTNLYIELYVINETLFPLLYLTLWYCNYFCFTGKICLIP